jgi:hypothetical protein
MDHKMNKIKKNFDRWIRILPKINPSSKSNDSIKEILFEGFYAVDYCVSIK